MRSTRFIIYEKSYLIRKGLISVIDKISNSKILYQIDNEDEFFELLKSADSDIIILNKDIITNKRFDINQIEDSQIILIEQNSINQKNVKSFVSETINIDDSQAVILKKINKVIGNVSTKKSTLETPDEISNREKDILKYIALGFSNKEIADKLFISAHTVVTHRKNITRKLGIKTVPGLTIYAILNKIIDINDTEKN